MKNKRSSMVLAAACLAALPFLAGCATGESVTSPRFMQTRPERVAVVDITGDIRGETAKNQVENFLAMELMRKGYSVIERRRVRSVMAEQDFQLSERVTDPQAAEIGRILGVPAVVMLDVTVTGEKLSLTGRMVSTETGEILWIGSGRGGSGRTLATLFGGTAGAVAGSQVGGGRGRTVAMVAGGVLGGVTGHALTPQDERLVHRAIKQMINELPQFADN